MRIFGLHGRRSWVRWGSRAALWVVLVVVLGVAPSVWARTFVIAIGNNSGLPEEHRLLYAEKDAHALLSVLERFGDAKPKDAVLMQGRSATEILQTLGALHARVSALPTEERARAKLIVYYSGHADGGGLHPGNSRISYRVLRESMQNIPVGVRVLIVDGCRSGGLTRVKGAKPVAPFAISAKSELNTTGFVMISSSTATEDSHESDDLKGSFFTHHFLNALRGVADSDEDGHVSLQESYAYAYTQTLRSSSATLSLQHPTLERRLRGRGALILSSPALATATSGAVVLGSPSTYLVYKDQGRVNIVAELRTERPGQMLRLVPGNYEIQQREHRQYLTYKVQLQSGEQKRLDPSEAEVLAYEQLVRKGGARKAANSVFLSAGLRGPLVHQSAWSPNLAAGYILHLEHFSINGRVRVGQGRFRHAQPHQGLSTQEQELGLGLGIERYVDLRWGSLSFGLWTEGLYFRQKVTSPNEEPIRHSFGAVFGGSFALQIPLGNRLGMRLELGPATYLLKRAKFVDGEERSSYLHTPFTGYTHLGGYVRF